MSRVTKISLLAVLLLVGGISAVMAYFRPWGSFGVQPVDVDLDRPDALVSSAHVARLPADLLKIPVLHDTLSEEFVFYYEQNDTRLSAEGAVRRIAFEHDLRLSDKLLANLLDEPGDLALWRGPDGKLRYWVLTIRRNALGGVLDTLAKVGLSDSQLRIAGELDVDGAKVTLYALHLEKQRTLLFAAAQGRMIVVSDAGMVFTERKEGDASASDDTGEPKMAAPATLEGFSKDKAAKLAVMLSEKSPNRPTFARFKLDDKPVAGHRVAVSTHFLSFGYQAFFPEVEALRFDYDGQAWSSQVLADGRALNADRSALWQALPGQPAACVVLPLDWKTVAPLAHESVSSKIDVDAVLDSLDGPLGVCWYAKSRLATPLFVAHFKSESAARKVAPALRGIFEAVIGTREFNHAGGRFPVETRKKGEATLYRRTVSSPFGTDRPTSDKLGDQLSAERYFPVTLALTGKWAAFSPDARLADDAVAVAAKRYPSAADGLTGAPRTLIRLTPAKLAQMGRAEVLAVLPKDEEPIFNGVAQAQLLPRLAALGRFDPIVAELAPSVSNALTWHPLTWRFVHP